MTAPAVTFSSDVRFTSDNKLVLSGTVSGDNVSKVEILTGNGVDLGLAQVSQGNCTFTDSLGAELAATRFKAEATISGTQVEAISSDFIITGIKQSPYTSWV